MKNFSRSSNKQIVGFYCSLSDRSDYLEDIHEVSLKKERNNAAGLKNIALSLRNFWLSHDKDYQVAAS